MNHAIHVAEAPPLYGKRKAANDVPPGYKRTEVGVIPEDWGVGILGKFVDITSGESPSRFQFDFQGIPYFKVEQLNNANKYIGKEQTKYFISKNSRYILKDSIVFPKRGASILLNKVRILISNSYIDTNLMVLTPRDNLYYEFLYYLLNFKHLSSLADTTSIPQINNKHINSFLISFPPLHEQRAIAEALSDVDALIESLQKLIDKKRALKTAAMQQLLTGKTRLPGFSGEWEEKRLGDIASIKKGEQKGRALLNKGGAYPVWNGGTEPSGYSNEFNMNENTITISEGGNSCGFVNYIDTKFWLGGHCYAIESKINEKFLFQALKVNENKIMSLRVGSGLPNIQKKRLENFKVLIPISQKEQTAIAQILSDMDTEIDALENRLEKTRAIKEGMMQELLTGRIRLIKGGII